VGFILGFLSGSLLLVLLWLVTGKRRNEKRRSTTGAASDSQRNARLGMLAGGLAHEIKNPLSTLSVNLQLLKEDWEKLQTPPKAKVLAKLAALEKETKRLEDILNDFLRFASEEKLRLEEVNVNELLGEIIEFIKPKLLQKNIEVLSYFDASVPSILLDVKLMKQALLNVFLNAEEAVSDGGQIVVKTLKTKKGVRIDIIDTGGGVPDDLKEKIFEVYFSTKKGGTGLGLPTAARIIEEHNGKLSFESEPGKGTDFIIEVPFEREKPLRR